jgi:hypothetical protein
VLLLPLEGAAGRVVAGAAGAGLAVEGLAVEGAAVAGRVADPLTAGLVLAAGAVAVDSLLTGVFDEGLAVLLDVEAAGLVEVAAGATAVDSLLTGVFGEGLVVLLDAEAAGLVEVAAGATAVDSLLIGVFGEGLAVLAADDAETAGRAAVPDSDAVLLLFGLGRPSVTGAEAVVDSVLYLSLNEVGVMERDTVLTGLEFFESFPLL